MEMSHHSIPKESTHLESKMSHHFLGARNDVDVDENDDDDHNKDDDFHDQEDNDYIETFCCSFLSFSHSFDDDVFVPWAHFDDVFVDGNDDNHYHYDDDADDDDDDDENDAPT